MRASSVVHVRNADRPKEGLIFPGLPKIVLQG
jgi:hypothetical protein